MDTIFLLYLTYTWSLSSFFTAIFVYNKGRPAVVYFFVTALGICPVSMGLIAGVGLFIFSRDIFSFYLALFYSPVLAVMPALFAKVNMAELDRKGRLNRFKVFECKNCGARYTDFINICDKCGTRLLLNYNFILPCNYLKWYHVNPFNGKPMTLKFASRIISIFLGLHLAALSMYILFSGGINGSSFILIPFYPVIIPKLFALQNNMTSLLILVVAGFSISFLFWYSVFRVLFMLKENKFYKEKFIYIYTNLNRTIKNRILRN